MKAALFFINVGLLSYCNTVSSLGTGAPTFLNVCHDLTQVHSPFDPTACVVDDCPFSMVVDSIDGNEVQPRQLSTFRCGSVYRLCIEASQGNQFRGFAVQSRVSTPELVTSDTNSDFQCGEFINFPTDTNRDIQEWPCPVQGITHTNRNDKTRVCFDWVPPSSADLRNCIFWFSITRTFTNFHSQLKGLELQPDSAFCGTSIPSQIQTQPVNETTILEREPFSLSCTASGNPAPTITWVREDGSDLNTLATMNTQSNPSLPLAFVTSTLSVPFALYSDSGRYRCSADNDISNPVLSDFSDITVRFVCASLLPLINGFISYSGLTFKFGEGTVATYICNSFYTLNGDSTRTCRSDGSWSGSTPAGCKENVVCPSLPPLTNGMISYSDPTLSEGTVATHTCSRIGYSPIGNTARICQSDRLWSGSSVTCQVVDCGPPIVPSHGRVHLPSGTTYGNFANYFCDECSNINGVSSVQYCGANGIWLLPAPTCQVLSECGLLTSPINGNVEMSAGSECGSIADYNCTVGYELRGVVSRVCQVSGVWNGTMPSCERVDCGPLQSPINGILQTFGTLFMSKATYYCHRGYAISGASHRTCGTDGQWRPNEPSCNPVECPTPAHLNNGLVTYSGTTFTNEATYSCDYGYTLQGSKTRICNANGGWQPSEPFCQIVDCGSLPNPTNGMVDLSSRTVFTSIATFTCDTGYTLNGSSFSECRADGVWSPAEPTCNAVDCGALEHPIYGSVNISHGTKFGNEAVYSCSDGYLLIGQKKRTCTENGTWSPEIDGICDPVDCGLPSDPTNGRVDTSSGTTFMSAAVYSCSTGYNLYGMRSRVCQANGLWSSTPPTCKIVDCGPLDNPANGLVNTESRTTYNSGAVYSCNEGHQLTGRVLATCMANGQWSSSTPTCDPLDCGNIEAPKNGDVVTSLGTIFNSSAKFSCDSGFNLTGCSSAQCLSNGSWSCDPPHCADNLLIKLKFGPTVHCVSWTEGMVELMYKTMQSSVVKAIQSQGHVIPKENVQPGYFSCYRSTTETTYRTTITGTKSLSAVDYADLIRQWVESGVTTRVQWYVIKIKKACPVIIASMYEDECE